MLDLDALRGDLQAESADLERLVAPLGAAGWQQPTPAQGWTVAHQIAHLAWTDEVATQAVTDPDAFQRSVTAPLVAAFERGEDPVGDAAARGALHAPAELLHRWRAGREALDQALGAAKTQGRAIPWFGPPMGVASMTTARLMETWAHGQDVADALSIQRTPTARLRHVADLGVRTRDFAFHLRGLNPPAETFRVELAGPEDQRWSWGPEDAPQRVVGRALDFALLVTQRRHPDDLAVTAEGADAAAWLTIAQAFAGPPGEGRRKGQFG